MFSIRQEKQRIRKLLLEERKARDQGKLSALSFLIRRRVEEHPLWRACAFPCIYISSKPGEVETITLIRNALAQGKRVCVPVIEPGNEDLYTVEIDNLDNLVSGHFGILEPAANENHIRRIDSPWDLAVVPGVAFDRFGHRIGFGKGYYDRFLARAKAPKLALAFSFQVVSPFETLPYDVRMDLILTEKETIEPL